MYGGGDFGQDNPPLPAVFFPAFCIPPFSIYSFHPIKWPDTEDYFSYNLLPCYTPHSSASGIYRRTSVIPHDKIPAIRDLVGQFNIALAQCLFCEVRLLQPDVIDIYRAVLINIDPVPGPQIIRFTKILLFIVKCGDISRFEIRCLDRENDFSVLQGG